MTPQEAREIDRQEAAAESARIRQMAQDIIEHYRARRPAPAPKPVKIKKPVPVTKPLDEKQPPHRPELPPLSANGRTMSRYEWAAHLGITYTALMNRLKRYPLEQALSDFRQTRGKTKRAKPEKPSR